MPPVIVSAFIFLSSCVALAVLVKVFVPYRWLSYFLFRRKEKNEPQGQSVERGGWDDDVEAAFTDPAALRITPPPPSFPVRRRAGLSTPTFTIGTPSHHMLHDAAGVGHVSTSSSTYRYAAHTSAEEDAIGLPMHAAPAFIAPPAAAAAGPPIIPMGSPFWSTTRAPVVAAPSFPPLAPLPPPAAPVAGAPTLPPAQSPLSPSFAAAVAPAYPFPVIHINPSAASVPNNAFARMRYIELQRDAPIWRPALRRVTEPGDAIALASTPSPSEASLAPNSGSGKPPLHPLAVTAAASAAAGVTNSPGRLFPRVRALTEGNPYSEFELPPAAAPDARGTPHDDARAFVIAATGGVATAEGEIMDGIGLHPAPALFSPHPGMHDAGGASAGRLYGRVPRVGVNFEIDFGMLHCTTLLGTGAFGRVYKARWRGSDVAVKLLIAQHLSADVVAAFRSEVAVLSSLRHPNILMFMGACTVEPNYAIVTEFMPRGSVWDLLHDPAAAATPLPLPLIKRMALDVSRGMAYLHSSDPPLLHRDLKSGNLLLDESLAIKISDFGLARVKAFATTMTGLAGTLNWMSPEVLANHRYTEKADVFSFGVVLWEMLTRTCPFEGMNQIQVAIAVLNYGVRPPVPAHAPPLLASIMTRCWDNDPAVRPSFLRIIDELEAMP